MENETPKRGRPARSKGHKGLALEARDFIADISKVDFYLYNDLDVTRLYPMEKEEKQIIMDSKKKS